MAGEVKPKIVKKTLHAGKGELPQYGDGTKAFFHYEVKRPCDVSNGMPEDSDAYKVVDSTRKKYPHGYGEALELVFGKKFALPVFETCLRSMHVGEVSQFDIEASELYSFPMTAKKLRDIAKSRDGGCGGHKHSGHESHMCAAAMHAGTGYPELDECLKDPTPLRITFELLKVIEPGQYEAESWQLSVEEKLESVDTLKTQGNQLFSSGKISEAIDRYKEALGRLETLTLREKPGEPEWVQLDEKNVPFYLNLSQCFLMQNNMFEAEETASEVLKRDEKNEKALFRRARARIARWKLDEAEEDLANLLSLNGEMKKLVEEQRELIEKRREEKAKSERSTAMNMMKALSS